MVATFIIAFGIIKSLLTLGRNKALTACPLAISTVPLNASVPQGAAWDSITHSHFPPELGPPNPTEQALPVPSPPPSHEGGHVISLPPHKGHSRAQLSPELNAGLTLSVASPPPGACAFASNSLQSPVSQPPSSPHLCWNNLLLL